MASHPTNGSGPAVGEQELKGWSVKCIKEKSVIESLYFSFYWFATLVGIWIVNYTENKFLNIS